MRLAEFLVLRHVETAGQATEVAFGAAVTDVREGCELDEEVTIREARGGKE